MQGIYKFIKIGLPICATIMLCCIAFNAQAQMSVTPGNTPYNVEYWLKADNLTTSDGAQIAQWVDANGKVFTGNASVNTSGSAPKMKYGGMNFQPAVNFATPARRMTSDNVLATDANRSYLTFYVSKTDLTGTTAGAVFAYRDNHDEGWIGNGTGTNNLYYYNGAITNFPSVQGLQKGYGITGFERNVTTSTNATARHNAKLIINGTLRPLATGSGKSVIGTRTAAGTGTPFYGDIQEIIVLSTPLGIPFSQTEIEKINSYLAIKYGQSLDPTSQPNLYNSSGVMVWNATIDNNYNNNMFGIARDNATGLYQKQSSNVDDNTLTTFLGNNLYTLNVQNGGTLNDMTYLIFGSNGQTGVSSYEYPKGTVFANQTLTDDFFSRRQNRIYRTQMTGTDSIILSMKITNIKAKYIMVSNSSAFTPGATRIYSIGEGNFAYNVVVKNGDYIGFVLSSITPGGITGYDIEFWLKADQIQDNTFLPNNSIVDRWDNLSEKPNDFEQATAAQRPSYTHGGMNFNPAVRFVTPAKRLMSANVMTTDANRSYLTFYVSKTTLTGTTAGAVFAYRANNDEGWLGTGTGANNLYYYNGSITNFPSAQGFAKGYGITGFERNTGSTNAIAWHNAKKITVSTANSARNVATGSGKSLIGTRTETGTPGTPFYGDIQEIIVLSSPLGIPFAQSEMQKIYSYLAIKYGQSLDTITQPNLYNSAGEIVWNSVANKGYNQNTFGLARDHTTGLYQKQSVNVEENVLTAFLGSSLYSLSAQNELQMNNMTYLIFGSNGKTGSDDFICADGTQFSNYTLNEEFISRRQNKIYKVQLTGADSVTLSFKTANIKANYIMVSGDIAFTPATTRLYVINNVGSIANNVKVKDGEYIGFAMMQKVPGGVGNYNVEFWLKADEIQNKTYLSNNASVALWENHSESMNNFEQSNNTALRPQYTYNGMNFHPAVTFAGSAKRLESAVNFNVEAPGSRIYRSFYVTRSTPSSTYGAVFDYRTNYEEGWYGTNTNYLYVNGTATTTYNPGYTTPFYYGITSFDRTNNQAWHNARVASGGTVRPLAASIATKAAIGSRNGSTTNPFYGDIQEIIILSTPPGTPFNSADIGKINSYLAIKYGQTLDTLSQPNLYSADGTVVWNGASGGINKGYNRNMFGIARDEITGLYQKQSTNIDDGAITLFLGDLLYTLNEQNTQRLNNGTYLLLGSNGKNETISYPFPAGTLFANKILSEACFNRQDRIYKTQLTGDTTINVSIKINKFAADYVMVSSSTNFTPTNTRIYSIVDGVAKNIAIADNEFIGFILRGTTPGGVTDYHLDLWLKADEIRPGSQPEEKAPVKNWSNLSGTMFDFTQNENNSAPIFTTNFMNYQPSVKFDKTKRLVSEENFQTDAGKTYRTFYVSSWNIQKTDPGANGNYGAVFAFRDNFDEGWVYHTSTANASNYLYYNFNATAAPANYVLMNPGFNQAKEQRRYGITSFYRGNTGATGVSWHNAKTATGGAAHPVGTNSGKAILGARMTTGTTVPTNLLDGDIQEVIVLSTPTGTPFDPVKISKITTYLAVKYGQMLDIVEHPVWLSSDSTVIWNTADHIGYNNNIFGIGCDNATGLYQKQSMSVGSREKITLFAGNELKPSATNKLNNGALANGFFLMMGSNGLLPNNAGQIVYAYNTGENFANDTLIRNIEFRHPTVLKAHITGATSFTPNIYLGGIKADYVLVSDDPAFSPLTTRIYHVDPNFVVSNILINQDEYLGFAYHQETPGGVGDQLVMWLKADEPSTIDVVNGETQEWRDFSGHPNDTYYYYNPAYAIQRRPGFNTIDPYMNFHSSVQFRQRTSDNHEFLYTEQTPFSVANVQYHTIVIMMRIDQLEPYGDRRNYFMGFNNNNPPNYSYTQTNLPALGFETTTGANPKTVGRVWQAGSGDGSEFTATKDLYNANATAIAMYIRHQTGHENDPVAMASSYFLFEADAHVDSISAAGGGANNRDFVMPNNNIMNKKGTIGRTSIENRAMTGTMSEVIFYEKTLTRNEKDRVYSYLGLKYGVTLDKDKENPNVAFNYFLSNDSIVWAGNSDPLHRRFHNNIAAIVRDDAARLNNLQSHSTDAGSAILMGIGHRLGNDPLLSGLNNDKEVIIWGHNGGDYTRKTYPPEDGSITEACGDFTEIIGNRIWILDALTQENYPVLIGAGDQGFNSGFNAFPYGAGWQVSLLLADSEQKLQNMEWDLAIPGVWTNKLHQFNVTFEAGKQYYFTFGAKSAQGDCEFCDVKNRFKNITFVRNTTWRNGWTSADFLLNDRGFNANVSVVLDNKSGIPIARFLSGYPRAYSNALRMYRSRSVQPVMRTIIQLDTAAMASFDLREIDYTASRYVKVTVHGECGSGTILPKLNYATTQKASFYTIQSGMGTAEAKLRRNAAIGNRNAWMLVDFDDPVHTIVIDQEFTGRTTGTQSRSFLLGPLSFACPAPPPPINEDGLSFMQQAMPQELRLCEEVTYTWRIQNANCNKKTGNFAVTLPAGMIWRENSLSIDDINIEGATINNYGKTATLTIDSLVLTPNETTIFRARAYFEMSATEGEYSNRAFMYYERIENSISVPTYMMSCDRMSEGCEPTIVTAISAPDRMNPLEIVDFFADKSCYVAGDNVQVKIVIKNPNAESITHAGLEVAYNETFDYELGSLTSDISNIGIPNVYIDEETGDPVGAFSLSGTMGTGFIIVPPGEHTITFNLTAPTSLEIDYDADGTERFDESGHPLYAPLGIAFDFMTLSEEDDCSASVFYNAYGEIEVEALPDVSIIGDTAICAGSVSQLSRWEGGTWTSNNPEVATVDSNTGEITGVGAGKTTFSFKLDGINCIAESDSITVFSPKIIGQDSIYVGIPEDYLPESGGEWESSDTDIATITQSGTLTGVSEGTVFITFTDDFGCSSTKEIEVLPTFTVTYKHNTSTPASDKVDNYVVHSYTIANRPITFITPAGCLFKEWNTKADGAGISYHAGQVIDVISDTTFYAIWYCRCENALIGTIEVLSQPTCNEILPSGSIYVEIVNGSGNYTYFVNDVETGDFSGDKLIINGLPVGNYIIKVFDKDDFCYDVSHTLALLNSDATTVAVKVEPTNANTCSGDGSLKVTVIGAMNYTYRIEYPDGTIYREKTDEQTSNTFTELNIPVGEYSLTIVDFKDCEAPAGNFVIGVAKENFGLPFEIVNMTQGDCGGDGSFTIKLNDFPLPISTDQVDYYRLDGGFWTPFFGNNIQVFAHIGDHTIEVMDESQVCISELLHVEITSSKSNAFIAQAIATTLATCGAANGTITLEIDPPGIYHCDYDEDHHHIELNAASGTGKIENLAAGVYVIRIYNEETTGDGPCDFFVYDVEIHQGSSYPLHINSVTVVNRPTCGVSNGSIQVNVSGIGNYEYVLNGELPYEPLPTNGIINNLPAGNYQVTVQNAGGCSDISATLALLNTGTDVEVEITATGYASACGATNGTVTFTLTDFEAGKYKYKIDDGIEQTVTTSPFTAPNISVGDHTLTIIDDKSCKIPAGSFTIAVDDDDIDIAFTLAQKSPAICGGSNGILKITVTDGAPTEYRINTGVWTPFIGDTVYLSVPAGTYKVALRSAEDCVTKAQTQVISNDGSTFAVQANKNDITAPSCGQPNGSIKLTITPGVAPYSYSLNGGLTYKPLPTDYTITDLAAGIYNIFVKDYNECVIRIHNIELSQSGGEAVMINSVTVVNRPTCGASNGSIQVNVSGGSGYEYVLNGELPYEPLPTNGIINNLPAGNYQVTVQNAGGCSDISATLALLNTGTDVEVEITATGYASACGATDGTVTFTVTGSGTYKYKIDDGIEQTVTASPFTAPNISVGDHTLTIIDDKSCKIPAGSFTIAVDDDDIDIAFTLAQESPAICGVSNGILKITVTDGTPTEYRINTGVWTPFIGDTIHLSLPAGTYKVALRSAEDCVTKAQTQVISNDGSTFAVQANKNDITTPSCGQPNGSIKLTITPGVAPYSYSLNGGLTYKPLPTDYTITDLAAGIYNIFVKDYNECVIRIHNIELSQSGGEAVMINSVTVVSRPTCGASNGSIQVNVSGVGNYEYVLNGELPYKPLPTNGIINNLPAGNYQVTVQNAGGCSDISATLALLNTGTDIEVEITATDYASACGATNGTVTFTVTGSGTYKYKIDDGMEQTVTASPFTAPNISVGDHTLTIIDDKSCKIPAGSFTIAVDDGDIDIAFALAQKSPAICGVSNGILKITVTDGTPTEYRINTGVWTSFIGDTVYLSVPAGTYKVALRSAEDCVTKAQTQVISNDGSTFAVQANKTDITAPSCGQSNGSIKLTITPGVAPYSYSLNGGSTYKPLPTDYTITGLAAGVYNIFVKDDNECVIRIHNIELSQSGGEAVMINSVTVVSRPTCGASNGSIQVNVSGGSGYEYVLNGELPYEPLPTNGIINNLPAGNYQVTVLNSGGCSNTSATLALLNTGTDVEVEITATGYASACGATDGTVTFTVTGSGTYKYKIDDGIEQTVTTLPFTAPNISVGDHTLTIIDDKSCKIPAGSFTIAVDDSDIDIAFALAQESPAICGGSNGILKITVTDGTPTEYRINTDAWTLFSGSTVYRSLPAGTYKVALRSAEDCVTKAQTQVISNDGSTFAVQANKNDITAPSCGQSNGSIKLTITPGVAPYSYSLNGGLTYKPLPTDSTITDLAAGIYNIFVKDDNECVIRLHNIEISQSSSEAVMVNSITVVSRPTCGASNGSIQVNVSGGSGYEYVLNGELPYKPLSDNGVINNLLAGNYQVTVRNAGGCSNTSATLALLNTDTNTEVEITATGYASACGATNGTVTFTVTGSGTYKYKIDDGIEQTVTASPFTAPNISVGDHTLTIIDDKSCKIPAGSFTIAVDDGDIDIAFTLAQESPAICGGSNGVLKITVTNGTPTEYRINTDAWTPFSGNTVYLSVPAGTYKVALRSAEDCVTKAQTQVISNDGSTFAVQANNIIEPSCGQTGSIELTITPGVAPYSYSLNGGLTYKPLPTDRTITGLAAGVYNIFVKDGNECVIRLHNIEVPQGSEAVKINSITVASRPTCGQPDGSIRVNVSGGSGYEYILNGVLPYKPLPADGVIDFLPAGNYQVTVQNADGCINASATLALLNTGTDVEVEITATGYASACGATNGTVTFTVTGSGTYKYRIDNGMEQTVTASPFTAPNISVGDHTLTIIDGSACEIAAGSFTIVVDDGDIDIAFALEQESPAICGGSNGVLKITVTDGTPTEYRINTDAWTPFTDNAVHLSVPAGTYKVALRSAEDCVTKAQTQIISNDGSTFAVEVKDIISPACGQTNGSVELTITNSIAPYSYSLNGGMTYKELSDNIIPSLATGFYDIMVKDGNNCVICLYDVEVPQNIDYDIFAAPPSATTPQTFCNGATVINLQTENAVGVFWYATETGKTPFPETYLLKHDSIYYAGQNIGECGSKRTAVKVILDDDVILTAPDLPGLFELCESTPPPTLADVPTYGNSNLVWYDEDGNPLLLPLSDYNLADGDIYYVAQGGGGSCVSAQRSEIIISISDKYNPVPLTVETPQHFCESALVGNLVTPNDQTVWYFTQTDDKPLEVGDKLIAHRYWAAQKAGSCESTERKYVDVYIDQYPEPIVMPAQCYSPGLTLGDLVITGAGIKWYDENYDEILSPLTTLMVAGKTYYATQSAGSCESDSVAISTTDKCYDPYGTVFPFVHTKDKSFDSLFITTAKLYIPPPAIAFDKIGFIRKQTAIHTVYVTYYDCTVDTIVGAPVNPGVMGRSDNPGLLIRWDVLYTDPGTPDNTNVTSQYSPCTVDSIPIGKYKFEGIAPGKYILEISRQGFLTRYSAIEITGTEYFGHRELLGGDVNNELLIDAKDLSSIRLKVSEYQHHLPIYEWKYDLNGDGKVDDSDISIINRNLGANHLIYLETNKWINP